MRLAGIEIIHAYKKAGYLIERLFPDHHFIYYNINSFSNTIFFHNQSNGHVSELFPVIENPTTLDNI